VNKDTSLNIVAWGRRRDREGRGEQQEADLHGHIERVAPVNTAALFNIRNRHQLERRQKTYRPMKIK